MSDASDTRVFTRSPTLAPDEVPRIPVLTWLAGSEIGKVVRLKRGTFVIGRGTEVDVPIHGEGISRRHAELWIRRTGSVYLTDLDSTNGTSVNGKDIGEDSSALSDGDRIEIGSSLLKFSYQDTELEKVHQTLYDSAVRDGLTGAYNKRYLIDRFQQEFTYARRHGEMLHLAIFDIDHFKSVNDDHGHVVGDAVLRDTCKLVLQKIRNEDLFARFGGEEFIVLMRGISTENALLVAQRIREAVANNRVSHEDISLSVTISVGLVSGPTEACFAPDDMLRAADTQLYKAKKGGRNQVCSGLS
jgi:two-component system cell cycle response regulator